MAKILVVEDETIVAWDIKETLEKLGHTIVDMVVSADEALGSAFGEHPDLVLMDIRLEGEVDGITAGDEIYHQLNIPVIYLTAHADEITLARATKTDPFGYITKPFQSQSLQSTIKVALQRHQKEESDRLLQKHLTNTLNSIGDGIITTDCQGLVKSINPIAEDLTGWDSIAAIGMEIDQFFSLTSAIDRTEINSLSLQAIWSKQLIKSPEQCCLVPKDQPQLLIAATATPIINPSGEIVGSMIVFQDNAERLNNEMKLWNRNQDLEFFQLRLISQLQAKTVEHQQAIAAMEVLNLVLKKVRTTTSEHEIFQIAIQQLGIAIDSDYCWITFHDLQSGTARIDCEYINTERQLYPISKIGTEIDLLLYPEFYNHLLEIGCWIDPPRDITPKPYVELLTAAAQILICPITGDLPIVDLDQSHSSRAPHPRKDRIIGEVGIVTTGKPPWTLFQSHLVTQTLNYAVQIFRQRDVASVVEVASPPGLDSMAILLSLEWLNGLKDNFSNSIASFDQDMRTAAEMLQQQINSFNAETASLSLVRHHQFLHQEVATNLVNLQEEWLRQFELIDILIDAQTRDPKFQAQSLNNILFRKWIAMIINRCDDLAERYHLDFSYQMPELLPQTMLYPFPLLQLMIFELFNNACKYTPPHYTIMLEIDIRDRQIHVNIVSFEVKIAATELAAMFVPFTPNPALDSRHGSTGLGLALVKKLLAHLGGNIHADSNLHSTQLSLTVPIKRDFYN